MKKVLLLFIFMLFITGCTINYEIEIYDNQVNETIDIYEKNSSSYEESKKKLENIVFDDSFMAVERRFVHDKDKTSNYYTLTSKTTYNFTDYYDQIKEANRYCRAVRYFDDGKYIEFKTYGYIKPFEDYDNLDDIKFTIRSNHKLVETNADEIDGYNYIWNINRMNYKDKIPSIKLYSDKYVFDYDGKLKKRIIEIVIIIAIILVVGLCIYGFINNKNKKANEI